jgi:CheY-like chemotaxis protein
MTRNDVILVVDGREQGLILFHQILRSHGYDVVLAASADEGLAQARRHRPDLVLMDPELSGGDGVSLTQRLREDPLTAATPLAALATEDRLLDGSLREAGFCAVVARRLPLRALLDAVRGCLDASPRGGPSTATARSA